MIDYRVHLNACHLCEKSYAPAENIWSAIETDALVFEEKSFTWIVFRGTETRTKLAKKKWTNFLDIFKDLRFWKYKTKLGARAHKGFAKGAEMWFERYHTKLNKDKPVYISGHSLGAAIAVQIVPLMKAFGFNIKECIVFGEPNSWYKGDEYLYKRTGVPTTSYLHANDFIRVTPPWGKTGVPRTHLKPKGGISRKAHLISKYYLALTELAFQSGYQDQEEPMT